MLLIKCGMKPEADVIEAMLRNYGSPRGVMLLSGVYDAGRLDRGLGFDVSGAISVGTCGGLCPGPNPPIPPVGNAFVASQLWTSGDRYDPCTNWSKRISDKIGADVVPWWSTGLFNTADNVADRTAIWHDSGAEIIDDESFGVAEFARKRQIPFAICRVVSDTCIAEDDLPPAARNALQAGGRIDVFEVIASVLKQPEQLPALELVWKNFNIALAKLRVIAQQLGPMMQFR